MLASTPPRSLGIAITHQPPVSAAPDDCLARLDGVEPTLALATNERSGTVGCRTIATPPRLPRHLRRRHPPSSLGFVLYGHELYSIAQQAGLVGGGR